MQVARMCATRLRSPRPFKFRYTQRVFRGDAQASRRELTQIGLENIGDAGARASAEQCNCWPKPCACAA